MKTRTKHRLVTPSSSAGYIPNNGNWVLCDICGFRMRAFEARTQPHGPHTGLLVCRKDYDPHNPQWDEIEAVAEKIVPDVVNPEPDESFITTKLTSEDF